MMYIIKLIVGFLFTTLSIGQTTFPAEKDSSLRSRKESGLSIEENSITKTKITIRVNTFRRNELLATFIDNYLPCSCVSQIQIVWSDTQNPPPKDMISKFSSDHSRYKDRVAFEIHRNNSLSNRFLPILPIPTEAVLSIDDDIVLSCNDLAFLLHSYLSNRNVLIGISPRLATYDSITGTRKYLRWQHTWWNGAYSIVLTKASLFHKKFLQEFSNEVPLSFRHYIDKVRNCEDLAMAYIVAQKANAAPVWVSVPFFDIASGGISSASSHFDSRSECLQKLDTEVSSGLSPWVVGWQKVFRLNWMNTISLLWDNR